MAALVPAYSVLCAQQSPQHHVVSHAVLSLIDHPMALLLHRWCDYHLMYKSSLPIILVYLHFFLRYRRFYRFNFILKVMN